MSTLLILHRPWKFYTSDFAVHGLNEMFLEMPQL